MNDEPPRTSTSQDNVTFRMLLALGSFVLAGFLAFFFQKAQMKGPGRLLMTFTAAGESWFSYGRIRTGLQRADHVEFFDDYHRLAMSCPRYSVLTIWETPTLDPPSNRRDVNLQGRPVGLTALGETIVVLQRPPGDDRHIKPGFFEVFDRDGKRIGEPVEVGWEPDQMEFVERDGKTYALILFSGSAEGETDRPAPSLLFTEFDPQSLHFEKLSQVDFEADGEDPLHFHPLMATIDEIPAARALVSFDRKPGAVWIDWTDPSAAKIVARHAWPESAGEPARYFEDSGSNRVLVIPTDLSRDAVSFPFDGGNPSTVSISKPARAGAAGPEDAEVRFLAIDHEKGMIGRYGTKLGTYFSIPLKGPYGFGSVRLTDLAVYEGPIGMPRKVAAIDRSGGLHWISGHRPAAATNGNVKPAPGTIEP